MKIGVITGADHRDRQKFISTPLIHGGHDVRILKTRPFGFFWYRLRQVLIKEQRADVIIFMGTGAKELLAYFIIVLFDVPFVVRLGGDRLRDLDSVTASHWRDGHYLSWLKYRLDKYVARFFLKKMRWAIVVNQALANRVAHQLREPHRIFVIPQFCEGPSITKNYSITPPVELLAVANFRFSEKAEGVIWLIAQLDLFVRRKGVAVIFRVAGAGLHLGDVRKHLQISSLSDLLTVEIAGFVIDLDSYYSRADILLYRSFHDATPNVILESKRYGLPLLVNDCEEFRSLVEHDVSGLLYHDAAGFFTFLEQLLAKQDLRERIGQGASSEHEFKYSEKAAQQKIENALDTIVDVAKRTA
jgi:glycosyltransferase involved in cell wall biosynthesis